MAQNLPPPPQPPPSSFDPNAPESRSFGITPVPLSAMTGLHPALRKGLQILQQSQQPFSGADQPAMGLAAAPQIPHSKAELAVAAASMLPWGRMANGLKALHEMSPAELDTVIKGQSASDAEVERLLFGEKDAVRYRTLQRTANSSRDPLKQDAAYKQVEDMEGQLSDAQRDLLYGINGPAQYNVDDARDMRSALGRLDTTSPEALGDSLKWAVTKFDPKYPTADPVRYAQLRHAAEVAHANNWDTLQIMHRAYTSAGQRFPDPEDARFILERLKSTTSGTVATDSSGRAITSGKHD